MGFALSDMQLSSSAFSQRSQIPQKHTGEGEDVSPPLSWEKAPEGTQSFAIFCFDPDAPLASPGSYGFVHWLVYNLPATTTSLAEGSTEGTAGKNNFDNAAYNGPMPPEGHGPHHYYFWVVALDRDLQLDGGLTLWEFFRQAEPHIIGMNRLVGIYERG